ncbi:META domain-containing protein [Alcanivorax sp. 24]|uniref:META domain-containing protein n=1 Tax=Alcanivorax sp. 24 TaxID=2545266 RepID=UPI00105BD70F|nr:META domain-containing protein [Alcanivorax sp. 24]
MKAIGLVLPLVALLAACDDSPSPDADTPAAPQPRTEQASPAPEPAAEERDSISGAWRPTGDQAARILVLAEDGELFLVGDTRHQGLSWERRDNQLALRYLNGQDNVNEAVLSPTLEKDTLTLAGQAGKQDENTPYAGVYQRDDEAVEQVSGEITFADDTKLPPQAVLAVTLMDSNRAPLLQRLIHLRETPQPFHLYLASGRLKAGADYSVNARVIVDGGVVMTTGDTPLQRDDEGRLATVNLTAHDSGPAPVSFVGRYLYHNEQAIFTPCDSDRRLTVTGAMADALAKAYQQAGLEPMAPLFMELDGTLEKRRGREAGTLVDALVVRDYRKVMEPEQCEQPSAQLTNTYWKLIDVDGRAASPPAEGRNQAHLILAGDNTVKGNTSCNRLTGGFTVDGDNLTFTELTTTERACTGDTVSGAFLTGLEQTRGFRIDGERLSLYDQENHLLAVFTAEYL